mmetsp:Transcript_35926/g.84090  ORF Transcript_35926/g.84090 Transcript_35926/m.84090 type:complete len:524 (-) Transcript_35926:289-1860(-)
MIELVAAGTPVIWDPESARQIVGSWATHVPSEKRETDPKYYVKMNKAAVTQGRVSNAKQLAKFRGSRSMPMLLPEKKFHGKRPKQALDPAAVDAAGTPVPPPSPMTAVMVNQYGREAETACQDRTRLVNDRDWRSTGALRFKLTKSARWKLATAPRRQKSASEPVEDMRVQSRPSTAPVREASRSKSDVGPQKSFTQTAQATPGPDALTRPSANWAALGFSAAPWWQAGAAAGGAQSNLAPGAAVGSALGGPPAASAVPSAPRSQVAPSQVGSGVARASSLVASQPATGGAIDGNAGAQVSKAVRAVGQSGCNSNVGVSELSFADKPLTFEALKDVFQQLDLGGQGTISKAALVRALRKSSSVGAVAPLAPNSACSAMQEFDSRAGPRKSRPGSAVAAPSAVHSAVGSKCRSRPLSASCTALPARLVDEGTAEGTLSPQKRRPASACAVGSSVAGNRRQVPTSQVSASFAADNLATDAEKSSLAAARQRRPQSAAAASLLTAEERTRCTAMSPSIDLRPRKYF